MKYKVNGKVVKATCVMDAIIASKDDYLDFLIVQEKKAVEDYRKGISNTNDPKLIELYNHILQEEIEHIEELKNAKNGEFTSDAVDDSIEKKVRSIISDLQMKDVVRKIDDNDDFLTIQMNDKDATIRLAKEIKSKLGVRVYTRGALSILVSNSN